MIIEEILTAKDLQPYNDPRVQALRSYINSLILDDFNSLVTILYRVDINENQLKTLLGTEPSMDAAIIIADLIIKRQLQKMEAKKRSSDSPESAEERW